jgi:hypothetical protein
MALNDYNTIPELIKQISEQANKLENGELSISELENMLKHSRDIHERITILRYKALTKAVIPNTAPKEVRKAITKEAILNEISTKKEAIKKEESSGFSLNFEVKDNDSQRDIIDQINEDSSTDKSVNEQLSANKKATVAENLQKSKIEDLRKVIGLNQKFLFMNDLFEGEKAHYDYALNQINVTNTLEEANDFLENELATKFNWNLESSSAQSFKELIKRKFS